MKYFQMDVSFITNRTSTRNINKDKHKTYPNLIKMLSLISALGIIE